MKILFLVAGMSHYRVRFHELNRQFLNSAGHEYRVLLSHANNVESLQVNHLYDWITRIKSISLFKGCINLQLCLMEVIKADVLIVVNENKYLTNILYFFLQKLKKSKFCLFGHGINYQSENKFLKCSPKFFLQIFADLSFVYNERCLQELKIRGLSGQKYISLNNAIDVKMAPLQFEKKLHEITFVGSLRENKKIFLILDVFKELAKQDDSIIMNLIGDGPLLDYAKKFDSKMIKIHGAISGIHKETIIRRSKILFNPGLIGLVAVESLRLGTPILGDSTVPHSPEEYYLQSGRNCWFSAKPLSVIQWVEQIRYLIDNNAYLMQLSEGCISSGKDLTVEAMSQRFCVPLLQGGQ